MFSGMKGLLAGAGLALGIRGMVRGMDSMIEKANIQEQAERDLTAALRDTGMAAGAITKDMAAYAAGIQEVTIYGDEEILSQMAFAKNLGVSTDQLKASATAAVGLAAKYRLDLKTAMMLVGRASKGQTQMLTRYGIVLTEGATPQEKFNELLEIGADNFGLAEEAAKTAAGSMANSMNRMGDAAENLGEKLAPLKVWWMEWKAEQAEGAAYLLGHREETHEQKRAKEKGELQNILALTRDLTKEEAERAKLLLQREKAERSIERTSKLRSDIGWWAEKDKTGEMRGEGISTRMDSQLKYYNKLGEEIENIDVQIAGLGERIEEEIIEKVEEKAKDKTSGKTQQEKAEDILKSRGGVGAIESRFLSRAPGMDAAKSTASNTKLLATYAKKEATDRRELIDAVKAGNDNALEPANI